MSIRITYRGPTLSGHGSRKAMKQAFSVGLQAHRKSFMQIHFTLAALARYPEEYAAAQGSAKYQKGKAFQEELAKMNPTERRAFFANVSQKRAEYAALKKAGALEDPRGVLPLVQTGRLRRTVLEGDAPITGSMGTFVRMTFNPPYYTFFNPPGQINKVKAIETVSAAEDVAFTKVVDAELQRYLNETGSSTP